jgi:hypothetical protein
MRFIVVDRHLLRDAAFAILLALPTLALARPQEQIPQAPATATPIVEQAADAGATTPERRFDISAQS